MNDIFPIEELTPLLKNTLSKLPQLDPDCIDIDSYDYQQIAKAFLEPYGPEEENENWNMSYQGVVYQYPGEWIEFIKENIGEEYKDLAYIVTLYGFNEFDCDTTYMPC